MARNHEDQKVKPANDAYTGMLAVSLFALLLGCGVLYLDYSQYGDAPPKKPDYNFRERIAPESIEKQRAVEKPADDNPEGKLDDQEKKG